jgi:radical SAM family uncharacterized protein/radical SAM-linked protein
LEILPLTQRPSRYIGGEVNSIKKDPGRCKLSFALAFPDAYEVGMSHLGIQILYAILNREDNIMAERFFAPWPDMEFLMRNGNVPLTSLESGIPLNKFDIVGFSLQYELSYTNVLNMLDLGGIPLYAADRGEGMPVIIGGGPCTFNPGPMSPFFDAFVIGEGEEAVLDISRAVMVGKKRGYRRAGLLKFLSEIEGVYVPAIHGRNTRIKKRVIKNLNDWCLPQTPVVPLMKSIHDRITLEIARGCTRGCRFCQAGMVWRPVRERSVVTLKGMADNMVASTGYDEISLLSLSSGDYSLIEPLLSSLMNRYYEKRIALALPSMRVETLTMNLIEQIKRVRKTSFTLAPEAGTQRLRNVINKGNSEEDLLLTAGRVFSAGWRSIKLYFMLGLPTETEKDLDGIINLAYRVLREGGNRRQVTVSLSTFVPKPHTPFQWQRQIGLDEILYRQEFFKKNIRHRNLNLKWHDGRMSLLEGVLSRGDEKIGSLVERAFSMGCRFDGWGDQFRFDLWENALEELHVTVDHYLGTRDMTESLPWEHIDCGLKKAFLMSEHEKGLNGDLTQDCRFKGCHNCGVCTEDVKTVPAGALSGTDEGTGVSHIPCENGDETIGLRIRYAKENNASFLSHLETAAAFTRGITRSGLVFTFSQGFHPSPKVSFPNATPVGIASRYEYADIQVKQPSLPISEFVDKINPALPSGMEILDIEALGSDSIALSKYISGFHYKIDLFRRPAEGDTPELTRKIGHFLSLSTFDISRWRKGKETRKDIRPFIDSLSFDEKNSVIRVTILNHSSKGGMNPLEVLVHVLRLDDREAKMARIRKTGVLFADGNGFSEEE